MNYLAWNCRGVAAKGFTALVKDIRKEYDTSLIFLLETHASGVSAQKKIKRMGFSGYHVIDSCGQAGGIWCLWDMSNWNVEILESSSQMVHLRVSWKGQPKWLLTVVYANPYYVRRQSLWDELVRIAEAHDEPWAVLGDFNCILADSERKGGAEVPSNRGRMVFRRMVQDCNLIDAGYQGSPYTWRKGNLFQRLDRTLINMHWRLKFPQAVVFHLPYFKSDHRAVLMRINRKANPNRRRRPFRFQAAWLTHNDFPNLMKKNWKPGDPWDLQVSRFQGDVLRWNKDVFGNIFSRKKSLMKDLEIVDDQLASNPSHSLEATKNRLWQEYETVLFQEELLWFQKSRSKWLYFGDRNTRFFHGATAIRRRRNSFDILQDDQGNWIGEQNQIEHMVNSYFHSLFSNEGVRDPTPIFGAFPVLSEENVRLLSRRVTRGDIYNVIKHMNPFKAPGKDGLQAAFF